MPLPKTTIVQFGMPGEKQGWAHASGDRHAATDLLVRNSAAQRSTARAAAARVRRHLTENVSAAHEPLRAQALQLP
jgi:hypothetical protein